MESNPKVLEAYSKGIKIIDSCKNEIHLQGANNYIKQFYKVFKSQQNNTYLDSVASSLYDKLYRKFLEKTL